MLVADPENRARLELSQWPENGWSVQQFETLVEVRFPGMSDGIQMESGLVLKSDERIASIESDVSGTDAYLRLSLRCACSIIIAKGEGETTILELVGERRPISIAEGPAPATSPMPPRKVLPGDSQSSLRPGELTAEEARERLLEQLVRAAEAGLVDLSSSETDLLVPEQKMTLTAEIGPATAAPIPTSGDQPSASQPQETEAGAQGASEDQDQSIVGNSGLTETVAAEGQESDQEETPETAQPVAEIAICHPADLMLFPELAPDEPLSIRIADLRGQLVGEFDRSNAAAAFDLAKLYLSIGFTDEARLLLAEFARTDPRSRLLSDISMIIDGEAPPAGGSIYRSDCTGHQALWRGLAAAAAGNGAVAIRDELLSNSALDDLPQPMRLWAATELGHGAVQAGNWDAARRMEALSNRAARRMAQKPARTLMLSAELARWEQKQDVEIELLDEVRRRNTKESPAATFRLAEIMRDGPDTSSTDLEILKSEFAEIALLNAGTELGSAAMIAESRLLERTAGREPAIELLSHAVEDNLIDEDAYLRQLSELAQGQRSPESSRPIALVYLDDPGRFSPALEQPGFRQALAKSMIDLGLPGLAAPLSSSGGRLDPKIAGDLARAFLETGDYQSAIEAISRMPDGQDKQHLLGTALAASGDQLVPPSFADNKQNAADQDDLAFQLSARLRASLARGDLPTALDQALERLRIAPSVGHAEKAAMLALRLREKSVPDAAAAYLRKTDPVRLDALELLFDEPDLEGLASSQQRVADYLQSLDAEIATMEEMLNGG